MDENKPKNEAPAPEFQIEIESVIAVATVIGRGGRISNCKAPDVKHTLELLARVIALEELAPGVLSDILSTLIPHYLQRLKVDNFLKVAQQTADEGGFGDKFRAVVEAADSGKKSGEYVRALVDLQMQANNWSQADAVRAYALHTGREEDSVRRTVTRQKARAKK